jgi:hypothetical protein
MRSSVPGEHMSSGDAVCAYKNLANVRIEAAHGIRSPARIDHPCTKTRHLPLSTGLRAVGGRRAESGGYRSQRAITA